MNFVILQRNIGSTIFMVFCIVVTMIALASLTAILFSLITQGMEGMNLAIFTQSTPPPGGEGGLLNAIVGSIAMCFLGMVIALFFGIFAGTWLSEFAGDSPYGSVVRFINDILLSAPSIVVGLFVYGIFVAPLGGFSGLAGSVALAMIATPVITRTTEDVLRLQATSLREASVGLGAPMWTTVILVLWQGARAGILTGALLAFARITGETAPLLFTALNNQFFSLDLTKPTASLPIVIYNFALSAYDDQRRLAWAGALLIAITVLIVGAIARIIARESRT